MIEEKTVFVCSDGKKFDSHSEAEYYENHLMVLVKMGQWIDSLNDKYDIPTRLVPTLKRYAMSWHQFNTNEIVDLQGMTTNNNQEQDEHKQVA